MTLSLPLRAVVTGAGSGLGRAFCEELSTRGASVLAADLDLAAATATAEKIGDPSRVHAVACDVTHADQVARLVEQAQDKLGGVDLLVNNAGVAVGGPVGDVPLADWEWIMGVNLWGVIYGCHAFVPVFKRQGSGHILNVASAAGLLSAPEMGPYNVTKAGVIALSETLRAELAPSGVGVTVLCPTFFPTAIAKSSRSYTKGGAELAQALMDRATITANGVARRALEGCADDELYVIPQADGAWLWRLKRAAPDVFHAKVLPRISGLQGMITDGSSGLLDVARKAILSIKRR